MNNIITIEYTDGSRASWVVPDDAADTIQHIEDALILKVGQPDSIRL